MAVTGRCVFKEKPRYIQRRREHLLKRYGIPFNADIDSFVKHKQWKHWASPEHLEYNLTHGDKDQYATYIPHLTIELSEPAKYKSFPIEIRLIK